MMLAPIISMSINQNNGDLESRPTYMYIYVYYDYRIHAIEYVIALCRLADVLGMCQTLAI